MDFSADYFLSSFVCDGRAKTTEQYRISVAGCRFLSLMKTGTATTDSPEPDPCPFPSLVSMNLLFSLDSSHDSKLKHQRSKAAETKSCVGQAALAMSLSFRAQEGNKL